ncbi:tripartite ATP-independent transporter DctM subunit [Saccharomonospora amisosensis]|uniref:Tripartite ATP-independent transporter DctM subunit n=1 Tax=Saccharomonospora amisosensis TaxID=1128677 RepID=A0A7X5ZR88_9PSEU|nr:TRAP transporter large permease [Saccharomonospora amisosensis]NIJ12608.1 tripartite ATP-independent transporter DctM subunit [Saccharomonospora amisosensis]
MNSLTTGAIIGAIGLVLFLTGMPIAFALGLTAIISILLFLDPDEFELFGKLLFDSTNDFGLLAIPLFVLMGNLFGGSAASRQLFAAGEAWLNRIRGGLGMSSVLACAVFAALTGSSPATAAAIGRVAVPEMQARGYSARVAAGAIAAGGTLGILIPPSVTLILYGIAAEVSIGQLFAAGIVPGILVTILFVVWIFIAVSAEARSSQREARAPVAAGQASAGPSDTGVQGGYVTPEYTWGERFRALLRTFPFLALIVAILGVLYAGIATPSEAAAVGVVLVFVLIALVYRQLKGRQFLRVLLETTNQSTMILLITAFSAVIATVLSFLSVPQELAMLVTELEVNRWLVMLVINILLLVMGLFLPPVSIIVMVTPVLLPLIVGLGFDPIWFGIIMTLNMEMGLITPPVGLNLYVLKGIAPDVPIKEILVGALPYVVVLAVGIVLLSVFPSLVTWLPGLLF